MFDNTPVSLLAAGDLSAKLWRFGKLTSTGVTSCSVAGERADVIIGGSTLRVTAAGDAIDAHLERVMKIEYGGTVTKGDALTTDTVGRAVLAGASDCVNAICNKTGVLGDFGECIPPLGLALPAGFGGAATYTGGAIAQTVKLAKLSVTGAQAFTLADGTTTGQTIHIECTVAASSPVGTLTIATPFSGEQAVYIYHAVGQAIALTWDGTAWKLLSKKRAGTLAVVVGTTVLTNYVLTETYNLSVTGTVHSLTTMGIPAPQIAGEYMRVTTGTAASTPLGDIAITGFTKALVAATSLAGINATTATATFISNGASWDNSQLTTATFS